MTSPLPFESARVRPAAAGTVEDIKNAEQVRIWRWYAHMMEERRVLCEREGVSWTIFVDCRQMAKESSFETAIRAAYTMMRALTALNVLRVA
ncbi:hypothetical protein [Paraburkholderia sp.]|uniref:hypothetical protein n=1 Tax=Paraburkholderia sp. TaxID=1926495 RepID=UPI00239BADF3|nr:hypothetical protein [Paraburkholderia sp.]MDE1184246.1 hypothetical protein [Paraburkholderia sp.]